MAKEKQMPRVEMYTKFLCPYCARAKRLLSEKGVEIEEVDIGAAPQRRAEMMDRSGGRYTVPQIFIGDHHVGGSDDLAELDRKGELDRLLGLA
jgi:glutaredoxin 3